MGEVTTEILLDTRRIKRDGTYPVKLRVTHRRVQKYYKTKYSYTEEEYNKIQGGKPRKGYKGIKLKLNAIEKKAIDAINELEDFSFPAFERRYLVEASDRNNIFYAFEEHIKKLYSEGRIKTAQGYESSLKSLRSFTNKEVLEYKTIDQEFLKSYEQWMLNSGKSLNSIGIYLRNVRALFNEAIAERIIKDAIYPFGKRKYQIPKSSNVKRALSLDDIEKIFNYEPRHMDEAKALDLWKFSYLCNGINIKDIARLKYKNIEAETITFLRSKTIRTSRKNLRPIVAVITAEVDEIIEKWGNKPRQPDNYVFPILSKGDILKKEEAKITNITRSINHYMGQIGRVLGIEKKITTYVARHSHASILIASDAPFQVVYENLGHHDYKTTQGYISELEISKKKNYISHLTNFNKKSND